MLQHLSIAMLATYGSQASLNEIPSRAPPLIEHEGHKDFSVIYSPANIWYKGV